MARPKNKRNRKSPKRAPAPKPLSVAFHGSALQAIRQHARTTPQMEICGVLIGRQSNGQTLVIGAIAGEGAAQGGAHVTFTQETWTKIHEKKDERFPEDSIVGWYHSHPGFGVFLSNHDLFIHQNFFAGPGQLAWVFDPHSDEEGCFGWDDGQVHRLERIEVLADKNEASSETVEPLDPKPQGYAQELSTWLPSFLRKAVRNTALVLIGALFGAIGVVAWIASHQPPAEQRIYGRVIRHLPTPSVEQPKRRTPFTASQLRNRTVTPSKANTPKIETQPIESNDSQQNGERDEQQ